MIEKGESTRTSLPLAVGSGEQQQCERKKPEEDNKASREEEEEDRAAKARKKGLGGLLKNVKDEQAQATSEFSFDSFGF